MNFLASNLVEVRSAVFREPLTFERIYSRLTPGDKFMFMNAFKHDRVVLNNMIEHDVRNVLLYCPACCLDLHSKRVPWSTDLDKRNGIRIGEALFDREHLVLTPKVVKWSAISNHEQVEGDYYALSLERSKDPLTENVKIPNTRSKIGNIAPGDGKFLYDNLFGNQQFETFKTVDELYAHFRRCHLEGAVEPKPDRVYKVFQRNAGEMELRLFPLWDHPLQKDSEHQFDPWMEIRYHQYYVRSHVTQRPQVQTGRTDWQTARLMTTIRHKAFRAYSMYPLARSPITTQGRYLSAQESRNLFHIKLIFHLLVQKSMTQQLFNLNLNSISLQPIANLVLINDFLEEYWIQEFGLPFENFLNW